MQRNASEEDFQVNLHSDIKIKKKKPFSVTEHIPAMHAIQVDTDYFGRWIVTIIDLDSNEITKLYETGNMGNWNP